MPVLANRHINVYRMHNGFQTIILNTCKEAQATSRSFDSPRTITTVRAAPSSFSCLSQPREGQYWVHFTDKETEVTEVR